MKNDIIAKLAFEDGRIDGSSLFASARWLLSTLTILKEGFIIVYSSEKRGTLKVVQFGNLNLYSSNYRVYRKGEPIGEIWLCRKGLVYRDIPLRMFYIKISKR